VQRSEVNKHAKSNSAIIAEEHILPEHDEDHAMKINYPLTLFYDGACGVCSTEIRYYRSIADQRVIFVNIASANFDAKAFGKTMDEFQVKLHARDAEDHYYTGVEAFRRLWEALPSPFYPLLSSFVGLPGIHLSARAGYAVFARYRHLLPSSRATSCQIFNKQ
jgi:predicted DCC family thiol-disulfide oxidoreductase YuxK